jgi:predicted O-methyltransferase YrrM
MSLTLKRRLKNQSKRLMRIAFELGQRLKVDILPRHFYSEIPDIRVLRTTSHWKSPRSMIGVKGDIDAQLAWVDECTKPYRSAFRDFEIHKSAVSANGSDEGYGEVEADFLYCFIRAYRPRRIVQIGCGVSTAVCLRAAEEEGYNPEITCIEPYPTEFLKRERTAGRLNLVTQKIQDVGPGCVSSLEAGDLFFVDSSHTLGPSGEVNLIILEALPRLAPGTYAHFHDIRFPYDYNPDVLSSGLFFPHESPLLHAFLLMNDQFEICASFSMLYHQCHSDVARIFPGMTPAQFDEGLLIQGGRYPYPSSIFLRRSAAFEE